MTPSFEAFRLERRAQQAQRDGAPRLSHRFLRQALARDPDFAAAWTTLGYNYRNLGYLDSARAAWDEAMRRTGRLSEQSRTVLEITLAMEVQNDFAEPLRLTDLAIQEFPADLRFRNRRGLVLASLGRYEEARAMHEQICELAPFGPDYVTSSNRFGVLMALGRREEARPLARSSAESHAGAAARTHA